jgi:hypothetical protein
MDVPCINKKTKWVVLGSIEAGYGMQSVYQFIISATIFFLVLQNNPNGRSMELWHKYALAFD